RPWLGKHAHAKIFRQVCMHSERRPRAAVGLWMDATKKWLSLAIPLIQELHHQVGDLVYLCGFAFWNVFNTGNWRMDVVHVTVQQHHPRLGRVARRAWGWPSDACGALSVRTR